MELTRFAGAMSVGRKKAVLDISKSFFCGGGGGGGGALFTSGTSYTDSPGRRLEKDLKDEEEDESGVTGFVKEGTKRAAETVAQVGDTAKKIADDVWGNTKDTTQKIKDTVAGEGGDGGDQAAPTSSTPTGTHIHVHDVRKPSGTQ